MSFWALVSLLLPAAGMAQEPSAPLPWRVNGPLGFTVDAASFPDSAADLLEVYCRLPPATIASLTRSERGDARLKLSVALHNRFGAFHHQASQELTVTPSDTGGFGKVVLLRFPVKSGSYRMDVKLEDLLSRKRGLAYIGRSVAHSAELAGEISVPEPSNGRRVSNLEFVWGTASGRGEVFRHAGADTALLPNPDRLYGLLASEVRAHFIARGEGGAGSWHWRARLLDSGGQEVARRDSTVTATHLAHIVTMDISTLPAGGYDFEIQAWREGEVAPVTRRGRFSVAWNRSSWWRNPRDIEDEVHFLLDREEDEEAFGRMNPGEQEAYLESFWRERDPTPSTALNEARTEFFKRVEHANQTWSRSALGKGMFTDMGRVYIRHGEPDETLRQVIPAGDQTLQQLLQQIDASEDRPTGDVEAKGLGGDIRPFEVWIYEGERDRGIIAKPDPTAGGKTRKRLTFLFVDEQGYGDYRLRYTTE